MSRRVRSPIRHRLLIWLPLCALALGLPLAHTRPFARAQDSGPIFIQAMRQQNGLMVLAAPQPALPSFTATVHYQVGSAQESHTLYGATELLAALLLDGTSQVGSRSPAAEGLLLGQLDQLDARLRRARQSLRVADAFSSRTLEAEILTLEQQQHGLIEQLSANSFQRITEQLYRERGAVGPFIHLTPTEVQLTVTMPADQLSFFLGLERMRMSSFSSRGFYAARAALAEQRRHELARPDLQLLSGVLAAAFVQHPFGRHRATVPSIQGIGREELEAYHRLYFRSAQTVISIAGGVRTDELRVLASRYLGDLPRGQEPELLEATELPPTGRRTSELRTPGDGEVLLAFPRAATGMDGKSPVLPLLAELLADANAGALAPLLTEGLARNVSATLYPGAAPLASLYPDLLLVAVSARSGISSEALEARTQALLRQLAVQGPDPVQLEGARRRLRERLSRAYADPRTLAPMMARAYATWGDAEILNLLYRDLARIGINEVQQVARALFANTNQIVGLRLPPEITPDTATAPSVAHPSARDAAPATPASSHPAPSARDAAPATPASSPSAPSHSASSAGTPMNPVEAPAVHDAAPATTLEGDH